ncbi:RNA-binding protein [Alsobacter sp. SYSU M60028]|uniref:RNA-binding protein n=1 Tax=Alsobacter ponti TaxID=2962936 RepID=A0ABT1LCB9_9HYPH|nr:RNA-binding protein [Alsobacter ponti]
MGKREQDGEQGPERLCLATRQSRPVEELIRFVVGPDDTLVPDLRRKLPGRGVWVTATREAVREAVRRKAFARGLRAGVKVSPTLADDIEELLRRWARDSFSLANKAGQVVSGFSKVEAAIGGRDPVAGVVHASDAAADGVRKLAQALRRRFGDKAESVAVTTALDSSDLGLALGRPHVIHAALLNGPASRATIARFRALERFREEGPRQAAGAGAASTDTVTTDMTTDTTTTREGAG